MTAALSDLGYKGYMAYWTSAVADAVSGSQKQMLSVNDIARTTYMHADDIVSTLQYMGILLSSGQDTVAAISKKAVLKWKRNSAIDLSSVIEMKSVRQPTPF